MYQEFCNKEIPISNHVYSKILWQLKHFLYLSLEELYIFLLRVPKTKRIGMSIFDLLHAPKTKQMLLKLLIITVVISKIFIFLLLAHNKFFLHKHRNHFWVCRNQSKPIIVTSERNLVTSTKITYSYCLIKLKHSALKGNFTNANYECTHTHVVSAKSYVDIMQIQHSCNHTHEYAVERKALYAT